MKRIYYSSGSVLTGDKIADAVVHYAEALALRDTSDTVDIPVRLDTGATKRAQLLIGPASQLVVVPDPTEGDEPEDDDAIARMDDLAGKLGVARPQATNDYDTREYESDYEGVNFAEAGDEGSD